MLSFFLKQGDLRKMSRSSREEKDRANKIVNRCSMDFIHEYMTLATVYMKLILTVDEFHEKVKLSSPNWLEDTHNPVLLVVKRVS